MSSPRTPDDDYAAQVMKRWDDIRPGTSSSALLAVTRLERISKLHDQTLLDALRPFNHRGVRNMEDFRLLALLRREGVSLTATEASRKLLISKAATSARADRFSSDGLLDRGEIDHDRRASPLGLTSKGVELADECLDALIEARTSLLHGLTAEEITTLANLLLTVHTGQPGR